MDQHTYWGLIISLSLIIGNGLLVAAEYGLVGARRSRIESLAKRGHKSAIFLLSSFKNLGSYVAGLQIGITMTGIAIGSVTEPFVTDLISSFLGDQVNPSVSMVISVIIVTYLLVIIGELVPKYLTLKYPENVALFFIRPLHLLIQLFKPFVWLVQKSGAFILKPFHIDTENYESNHLSKEELTLLIKASSIEGSFEEEHALIVAKALKLDQLTTTDIMVHRLDIQYIDVDITREQLIEKIKIFSHNRIIVCEKDIDNVIGVLYLVDLLKQWETPHLNLRQVMRPIEAVPENMPLSKAILRMREIKTQLLLIIDEYGGTSGLITLEDVIEEVFGEMEDQLEVERPPIERISEHRILARASIRYDELLDFLGQETDENTPKEALAHILVKTLDHIPKLGDSAELPIGTLRVDNMARQRITWVSIQLKIPEA